MLMYLLASASMDLLDQEAWISSRFVSLPCQQASYMWALGVYGVQRLAHLSVLHSDSGNVKKFSTLVTIRFMRLMGVGEGWGSQGETGMVQGWSLICLVQAWELTAVRYWHSSLDFLWSTSLYYSCFIREENRSGEDMGFINFLSQGHIRKGSGPLGLFIEETPTFPHSCPAGSLENKTQSVALSKHLPESVFSEQTRIRLWTRV